MEVSGQLHASAALAPRKRASGTHCIGDWVGPIPVQKLSNLGIDTKNEHGQSYWKYSVMQVHL
jgi:hypothetical protein